MKAPQKRALATVLCDRRVVYETVSQHPVPCNSRGYDLKSHAAVLRHHTAALRCCAGAVGYHTVALRQPQDILRCCKGPETVTQSRCMRHTTAAHLLAV